MNQELSIILKLQDEASSQLGKFQTNLEKLQPNFKKMATIGTVAFGSIATAIGFATKEAIDAESEQNRLVQILKTTHGVTKTQIKLLNDQAKALQKVGVASDGNISIVQSQLATFDLTVDTLHRLTPAVLDYVIAEKGASATTEDFKQMTNGLAQALQGNFASLTRTGFVLDEATKSLISNGTEAERTEALVKVLGSTYEGFNQKTRETAEGGMVVLKNSFNEMMGTIGEQFIPMINTLTQSLVPIIEKVAYWVEQNPELARNIIITTLAVAGLVAVIGTLGLILPSIIAGFTLLASPVGIIIAIIGALAFAVSNVVKIMQLFQNDSKLVWDGIKAYFQEAVDWIISKTLEPLMKWIDKVVNALNRVRDGVSNIGGKVSNVVKTGVSKVGSALGINDGIVQNGKIITTHPDDYLIATKNPQSLGGGGVTININTMVGSREFAEEMGNNIIKTLQLQGQLS